LLGQIMPMRIQKIRFLLRAALAVVAVLLVSGCDTTKVCYRPKEHLIRISTHHSRLPLGPCLHSYDDAYWILLQEGFNRCEASQLEMYQSGSRLTITSGFVSLNRARRVATINLTLFGEDRRDYSKGPYPFYYNGRHRYLETDACPGECTRSSLQDFYRNKEPEPYYHH
jgi:hypothetical protein